MPIKFKCAKCNKELTVKDEMAGKQGKCPGCQSVVSVPASASSAITSPAPSPAKKKPVEEDDEVVAAAVVEDDEVDEEETPKKKKKSRRDDDDDDEEDERPSKAKKKSSRRDEEDEDDEDDEDERPSRKKRASAKRRDDDDDDDDDDEPKKQSPKKRRAGFKRASLGVHLNFIGHFVYAGALGFAVLSVLITAAMSSSRSGGGGGFLKVMGYLTALTLVGGMIVNVVGSGFIITTPGKNGELGLAIATVATSGVSLFMGIFLVIKFLGEGGGGGYLAWMIPFFTLNPFSGLGEGGGFASLIGNMGIGAVLILLPLVEIGRLTCFALFQWAVGKSQRDRETAKNGFLMMILAPSVCLGMGLLLWLLGLIIKSTSFWVGAIILMLYGLVVGGMLIWYALVMASTRGTLDDAR